MSSVSLKELKKTERGEILGDEECLMFSLGILQYRIQKLMIWGGLCILGEERPYFENRQGKKEERRGHFDPAISFRRTCGELPPRFRIDS